MDERARCKDHQICNKEEEVWAQANRLKVGKQRYLVIRSRGSIIRQVIQT